MMVTTNLTQSEQHIASLYEGTVRRVKMILTRDYGMSKNEAKKAIEAYRLEEFFIADADMAAHDANEVWAKRIYEFWLTNK